MIVATSIHSHVPGSVGMHATHLLSRRTKGSAPDSLQQTASGERRSVMRTQSAATAVDCIKNLSLHSPADVAPASSFPCSWATLCGTPERVRQERKCETLHCVACWWPCASSTRGATQVRGGEHKAQTSVSTGSASGAHLHEHLDLSRAIGLHNVLYAAALCTPLTDRDSRAGYETEGAACR